MSKLEKRFPHYSRLLRLYPASYRNQYGGQMLQTLADMLDAEPQRKRVIWLRTMIDLPISLTRQQLSYAGGTMTQQMPTYVKRNALISTGLILPFTLVLLANGLDKILNNRTLENTWLWHTSALAIWVLWLPAAAAIMALISFLTLIIQRGKATHTSPFRQLLNIRYSWPLIITGLAGLCIVALVLGHDSVHCLTGNPVRELHNWHQTWQCVQQR
jgi:hypothetical protein